MFVILSTYQARPGEEDAIIALHEDWQRQQQPKVKGYLSGELIRNVEASSEFIGIMRFESRASAHACASDPEQQVWTRRVASLVENVPRLAGYQLEWP